jgi:ABC-type transporter Mla subunit MlaD
MVDWKIDLDGVQTTLTNTAKAAEPLEGLVKSYGDDLTNLINGLNYDVFKVVAAAIGEYSQHWAPTIESAAKQINASLTGASEAVKAYANGQEEMAQNAQRAASQGLMPGERPPGGRNRAV